MLTSEPSFRKDRRLRAKVLAGIPFVLLLSLCSFTAQAAKPAATPAVDPALCNALVKHTPDANVAYQPGVDVYGKPVASADLPDAPHMQIPRVINIPLTINLAKAINLDTTAYPYNQLGTGTEAQLGMLSVEGDKVTFNGQSLSDDQQDNLAVLCLKPR